MVEWAVFNREDATVGLIYDNDLMDWFSSREEAVKAAIELANENGKIYVVAECENGDFGDTEEEYGPD